MKPAFLWCYTLIHIFFLEETDIPEISVELTLLDKLKDRIVLARQIDSKQHKIRKQRHEKNWLKEAAEAMELELDSDILR